jgi:hypothetical protein
MRCTKLRCGRWCRAAMAGIGGVLFMQQLLLPIDAGSGVVVVMRCTTGKAFLRWKASPSACSLDGIGSALAWSNLGRGYSDSYMNLNLCSGTDYAPTGV